MKLSSLLLSLIYLASTATCAPVPSDATALSLPAEERGERTQMSLFKRLSIRTRSLMVNFQGPVLETRCKGLGCAVQEAQLELWIQEEKAQAAMLEETSQLEKLQQVNDRIGRTFLELSCRLEEVR